VQEFAPMVPDIAEQLRENWQQLCRGLSIAGPASEEAWILLCQAYSGSGRHYHNLHHLAAIFDVLADVALPETTASALQLAVWYHDAVYDSRAVDNEERSSDLARAQLGLLRLAGGMIEETARLILLTKRHVTTAEDYAGQLLLDADLAILGAPADIYDRYASAIRQEYAWVEEEAYRRGRSAVLQRFLQRPRIYCTPVLYGTSEQIARLNMARELANLL